MNNIRKLKKKKRIKVVNPEQIAKQKLFQISNFQDQQSIEEPDTFLQSPQYKIEPLKQSPTHKYSKSMQVSHIFNFQSRKPRICTNFSLNQLKQRSYEYLQKTPLSITNYIVIDERKHIKTHQSREKVSRYDCANLMKRKIAARMGNERNLHINYSCDQKQDSKVEQRIRNENMKKEVASAIQIKNIKLFNKYPSFAIY